MKDDRVPRILTLGALGIVLVLALVVFAEVQGLDARFGARGRDIRSLGESIDRLTATVSKTTAPVARGGDELPPGVRVLHPEVANLLVPADTPWPPPGARTDGELARSFEYGDPKGFNPLLESSGILEERIYAYSRSRLAEPNSWTDPARYHGELAVRIEMTNDSKEFTAYLRPGVRWHPALGVNLDDPKYAWLRGDHEVTAQDVVFTLDLIGNPEVQAGRWKSLYGGLDGWKALDEHTLIVRWKRKEAMNVVATLSLWPTPRFLYAYDEEGKPLSKEIVGARFNRHWYDNKGFVGAGPYRMARYEPGSKIVLERNEEYFGQKPAIRRLVYPIYSDAKQTLLKLRAHELGDAELTPAQYREEILAYEKSPQKPANSPFFDGRIACRVIPRPAYSFVAWNGAGPFFADKRVRRAMTFAFDRRRIIDHIYSGLGSVATGPYPLESPINDPGIKPIPFDLVAAKKLLSEAGWSDTDGDGLVDKELHPGDGKRSPFEFRMSFAAGQVEAESTLKIFADDLSKIGVKIRLEPLEWSLLQNRKDERRFDAYVASFAAAWVTDLSPGWHSSQADVPRSANAVGFRSREADDILEALQVTFDEDARIRLFRAFHRVLDEEQPFTFVMVRRKVHCAWSDLENLVYAKDTPVENSLPWWVDGGSAR